MSINEKTFKNNEVLQLLNRIYQEEVSGVNRYLHYSFMITGFNRIPIQKWFRDNALESLKHAVEIGEKMTSLGGHPTLAARHIEEINLHTTQQLLEESLAFEEEAIGFYKNLVAVAENLSDIALTEMARDFVRTEVEHADEVRKMLLNANKA